MFHKNISTNQSTSYSKHLSTFTFFSEMCPTFTDGSKECFWFISNNLNWDFHDANAQCAEQDGVLASVTSLSQLDFLKAAFSIFM